MRRRLTDDKVIEILNEHETGTPDIVLAHKHKVSRASIHLIVTGQSHRDVVARWEADRDGTTEAELERIIAEQLPTMPVEHDYERSDYVPHAVVRGLGIKASAKKRKEAA